MSQRSPAHILIVDDEEAMRTGLGECLEADGHRATCCGDAESAQTVLREQPIDLVITDLVMEDRDGMELLEWIQTNQPHTPVIMITGYSSVSTAVEAMRRGAMDYIAKPFSVDEVRLNVRRVLQTAGLKQENRRLRRQLDLMQPSARLIGRSPLIESILKLVERIAPSDLPVLITGETGTGKELLAREIHRRSARADRVLLSVNCAALPETLLESELFGHAKGAFTGAAAEREGLFQAADGGTLFLDEIGDISTAAQARLLRVLQDGEIRRVGENRASHVDVRIIAATNQSLGERMRRREFREDLFHRLNVATLSLPPLRERREDIALLAEHFLEKARRDMGLPALGISAESMRVLQHYDWPGNVRELANVMERSAVVCTGNKIRPEDLPQQFVAREETLPIGLHSIAEMERRHITAVLNETGGNISKSARILEISRPCLRSKIERYGINVRRSEAGEKLPSAEL